MYNILAHRYAVLMQNTTLETGGVGKCIKAKHIDLTVRPYLLKVAFFQKVRFVFHCTF